MSLAPEVINGIFAISGAFVGAIVTGVFAIYVAKTSKEKREIVISTSAPSKLLAIHDKIAGNTEIFVSGVKVDNATLSDVVISNTGNKVISELDFPVFCQPECQIISFTNIQNPDKSSNLVPTIKKLDDSRYSVSVDYINPGEELSFRCLATGEDPKWSVGLRQPELLVIRRKIVADGYSGVVAEAALITIASVPLLEVYFGLFNPAFKQLIRKIKSR